MNCEVKRLTLPDAALALQKTGVALTTIFPPVRRGVTPGGRGTRKAHASLSLFP